MTSTPTVTRSFGERGQWTRCTMIERQVLQDSVRSSVSVVAGIVCSSGNPQTAARSSMSGSRLRWRTVVSAPAKPT